MRGTLAESRAATLQLAVRRWGPAAFRRRKCSGCCVDTEQLVERPHLQQSFRPLLELLGVGALQARSHEIRQLAKALVEETNQHSGFTLLPPLLPKLFLPYRNSVCQHGLYLPQVC